MQMRVTLPLEVAALSGPQFAGKFDTLVVDSSALEGVALDVAVSAFSSALREGGQLLTDCRQLAEAVSSGE